MAKVGGLQQRKKLAVIKMRIPSQRPSPVSLNMPDRAISGLQTSEMPSIAP